MLFINYLISFEKFRFKIKYADQSSLKETEKSIKNIFIYTTVPD